MKVTGKSSGIQKTTFTSESGLITVKIKKNSDCYILNNFSVVIVFDSPEQEYAFIGNAQYYQTNEVFLEKVTDIPGAQIDLVDKNVKIHIPREFGVSTVVQLMYNNAPLNILFLR